MKGHRETVQDTDLGSNTKKVKSLNDFLSEGEKALVRAPIADAETFARIAYISPQYFTLEIDRIFSRCWMALCFSNTIQNIGDVLPTELFGIPLLLVRGDDNIVRVFHNICPYDGCPVELSARRGATELTVPYHGWCYDLKGKLLRTPYWDGTSSTELCDMGHRNCDLVQIRSEERLGIIFTKWAGDDESIDDFLAPVYSILGKICVDKLVAVADSQSLLVEGRTVNANWKTYLENAAINILHESFTHDSYRKSPEVPRVQNGERTYFVHIDGRLIGFGYNWSQVSQTYPALPFVHIGSDRNKPPESGYFLTMFPNIVIVIMPTLMRLNICLPWTANKTKVLHCGYYHADSLARRDFQASHETICHMFHKAYDEDRVIIEAVQLARTSPVWERHFYSPFWDEPHYQLNKLILDQMEA